MNDNSGYEEITVVSWEQVRQRYYGMVLGFVRQNSPPYMDHEEIACECFERLRTYKRPVDNMGGFLITIAKNLIYDAERRLQKEKPVSLCDSEGRAVYEIADPHPWKPEERERLEEEAARWELQYEIWREQLDELPEWKFHIYVLRRFGKVGYPKISELLKMNEKRVRGTYELVAAWVRRRVRKRYSAALAARNDG